MATKTKTVAPATLVAETTLVDPTTTADTSAAPGFIDPSQIAAEAEAAAAAADIQRRAILAQLAQATQIPEADLLILFGFPA